MVGREQLPIMTIVQLAADFEEVRRRNIMNSVSHVNIVFGTERDPTGRRTVGTIARTVRTFGGAQVVDDATKLGHTTAAIVAVVVVIVVHILGGADYCVRLIVINIIVSIIIIPAAAVRHPRPRMLFHRFPRIIGDPGL